MKAQKICLLCTLLVSVFAQAQNEASLDHYAKYKKIDRELFEKISLELSYGYAIPISLTQNLNTANYNSFKNFQLGANYSINEAVGIRLTYAYHSFQNQKNSDLGVVYNKFMAEATYNIIEDNFKEYMYTRRKNYEIVAHAGFGATFGKSLILKNEKLINLQIGLKPTYSISNRVNVFLDLTAVANFKQDYGFDGLQITDKKNGLYFTSLIGLQFQLGQTY